MPGFFLLLNPPLFPPFLHNPVQSVENGPEREGLSFPSPFFPSFFSATLSEDVASDLAGGLPCRRDLSSKQPMTAGAKPLTLGFFLVPCSFLPPRPAFLIEIFGQLLLRAGSTKKFPAPHLLFSLFSHYASSWRVVG